MLDKLKDLGMILEIAFPDAADVIGLYPGISYAEGLEVLCKQYDKVQQ